MHTKSLPDPGYEADATAFWLQARPISPRARRELDHLVEVALGIADRDGLDALSMRGLAAEAGTGTTTLYRHVRGRDEVIALMADAVYAAEPLTPASEDWRESLSELARSQYRMFLAHPWLASLSVPLGPATLRAADHVASVVLAVAPDLDTADAVMSALHFFVRGAAMSEIAVRAQAADRTRGLNQWQRAVVSSDKYPAFTQIVARASRPAASQRFDYGLARLLDGIETLVHATA